MDDFDPAVTCSDEEWERRVAAARRRLGLPPSKPIVVTISVEELERLAKYGDP
jgi:hypothetical protein